MAQPKLDDVAAVAGVSPTTVSRVLNNRGYISERTREKVFAAMQEINYRPNAIARSLQNKKTQVVGLVFPTVADPFYGELAYRIESKLADAGYKVILCNSQDHPELEARYLDMLLGNQVDGVITGAHSTIVENAPTINAPLVTIDRADNELYPNIRCDNLAGATMATRALITRGARRILHLTSTLSDTNLRQAGYRTVMREAGLQPEILELGFTADLRDQRKVVNDFLEKHPGIDAVFASNDVYALLAYHWALAAGKKVPEDFQVIGFDGAPTVQKLAPHLATVVQPFDAIAERAVERLLTAVEMNDPVEAELSSNQQLDILPVHFYCGTTIRPFSDSDQ